MRWFFKSMSYIYWTRKLRNKWNINLDEVISPRTWIVVILVFHVHSFSVTEAINVFLPTTLAWARAWWAPLPMPGFLPQWPLLLAQGYVETSPPVSSCSSSLCILSSVFKNKTASIFCIIKDGIHPHKSTDWNRLGGGRIDMWDDRLLFLDQILWLCPSSKSLHKKSVIKKKSKWRNYESSQ